MNLGCIIMINKYFDNTHIITIIDLENDFKELHSFKPDDFIEKYEYNLFEKSRIPKYFKYSKVLNNIIYIKEDYYKTKDLGAIVYKKIPKDMNEIINKSDSVRYRAPDFTKRFFLNRKGLEYFLKNFNFEILENS